jgi:serine/threonine protein kinase
VRVFNLKNWSESSQYHSLAPPPTTTSTCGLPSNFSSSFEQLSLSRPLQEVACLHKLSHVLHPNIAPMVCHFKATTSDQHIMLARNFDAENLQALYTAAPNSDYLLVRTSTLTLTKHFENLRKRHYGIIPETNVLVTLAQLNLGIAHLVKNQISHCSINPDNIYIDDEDRNRLLLANFSQSVEFGTDLGTMEEVRSNLRLQFRSKANNLHLCPEVVQWLQETDTDYCYIQHDTKTLFVTNDSYSGARMIYSLLLGELHESVQQLDAARSQVLDRTSRLSSTTALPRISSLSPQCNHLLQRLVAPNISERLRPIEAAVASLVLLFGPRPSQVNSIEDCHQWLLAEAMQFYMRPVLSDSSDSDTSELYSRLLFMYLTIADKAPCLVWKFCSLFKSLSM